MEYIKSLLEKYLSSIEEEKALSGENDQPD